MDSLETLASAELLLNENSRSFTLKTIADSLGKDKRTVQNWLAKAKAQHGDLGELIEGTRYFSAVERELIESYGSPTSPSTSSPTPPPCKLVTVTVDPGNHTSALTPPELPKAFSLEGLRSKESTYFEDPLAVAEQFLAVADQIGDALDSDLDARRKRLQQTQKAKEQIADKAQELKLKQRIYRDQVLVTDSALNQETSALQDALEVLQKLGKDESK